MRTFYRIVFVAGIVGFFLFVVPAFMASMEDYGWAMTDEAREKYKSIFLWGGMIFIVCGFILLLETISYIRTSWGGMGSFGKFVSVFGVITCSILSGYIYHFFFVTLKSEKKSIGARS